MPTPAEIRKVNHLLAHVLAAAVARRWPQIHAGESGETSEGFYGDFAFEPVPPTDEELLRIAATAIAPYEISGITPGEYEPETECVVEAYGSELIAYARAVLARYGESTVNSTEA